MIDFIKYNLELFKLEKEKKKNNFDYKIALEKAKTNENSQNNKDGIQSEYRCYDLLIENKMRTLTSDFYVKKARKNIIPIPEQPSEQWEEIEYRYILTIDGVNKIRTKLRKNQKEAFEIYLPYITLSVGIIGAITGLIAVILK